MQRMALCLASVLLFLVFLVGGCSGGSGCEGGACHFCVTVADGLGSIFPGGCFDVDSSCAAAVCHNEPGEVAGCEQYLCGGGAYTGSSCSPGGNTISCDEG
jgi:hypothetical protein